MGTLPSQAFSVRPATAADGAEVWPLIEHTPGDCPPRREAFDPDFAAMVNNPSRGVFVAEAWGVIAGYLVVHRHATIRPDAPVAWVEQLIVIESLRRRGIARLLVEAAEEWARDKGCAHVAITTRGAEDFCEALGYAATAAFHEKILLTERVLA